MRFRAEGPGRVFADKRKECFPAMLNRSDFYLAPSVSRTAVNGFFAAFRPFENEIHAIEIHRGGQLVLRIAPAPYSCTDKREIYSLSKSFCSTAVGFLVDEGLLSLDARIADLFPESVPEHPQENLLKMKVRHVMSMNSGHHGCAMPAMIRSDDEVRAFMEQPIPSEPGTHFAYNTGATLMLSHIVEKITGMKLLDYLSWKLFMPLGISDVRWNRTPDGANEGGCGIHVSVDDISKLGLLYLNRGVWNGKRLLSEAWVREASSPISDNSANGSPDWCAGYGFQFWVNAREGFRGDGAYGQLCVVLPERDAVVAVETELGDMQAEIDRITELMDALFEEDPTPDSAVVLPEYPPVGSARKTAGFEDRFIRLEENALGWTGCYFRYDPAADETRFTCSDGADQYTVAAGRGHWTESTIVSAKLKPKLVDLMSTPEKERCRVAASCRAEDGKLVFAVRFLNCPHRMEWTFERVGENGFTANFESWGKHDAGIFPLKGTVLA
jgi:hypothetical protein